VPKIKLTPHNLLLEASDAPSPAKGFLPDWFREMAKYFDGSKKTRYVSRGFGNQTVKACPPFLDSMMSGYTITLPADVLVEPDENGGRNIKWGAAMDIVASHSAEQLAEEQVPEGYSKDPLKWLNFWSIQTPKGYSTLFVHPLNRTDLPFLTLSGVVDTDTFEMPINFPFLIKENFSGVIPLGTPIAQLIPFKREAWSRELVEFDSGKTQRMDNRFYKTLFHAYKKQSWNRKEYN
jgi:hypothetical protein